MTAVPFTPRIAAAVIRHIREGYGYDDAPERGIATAEQARAVIAHMRDNNPRVYSALIRDIVTQTRQHYREAKP